MAKTYPIQGRTRAWGVSLTIAAILLGVYLVSLFYASVVDEAARVDHQPGTAVTQIQPG